MNIAVYCGAFAGNNASYMTAARELGKWIAENNHTLVYGGGAEGMMGELSKEVLRGDGDVIGVVPQFMVDKGLYRKDLPKIHVTETVPQRKAEMLKVSDAYIALPGGLGTLEELMEVLSLERMAQTDKPCILYNVDGYYEPLREVFNQMVRAGFLSEADRNAIHFAGNFSEVVAMLNG